MGKCEDKDRLPEGLTGVVEQDFEIPPGAQLLEDFCVLEVSPGSLDEGVEGKRPRLKGRLGWVDKATANGRVYPKKVVEREIQRLGPMMAERLVYGELGHPGGGKTELSRASHFVLGAELKEDGEILGILEFIPGTRNGDQAIAIARAGGKLGVSSRGFGSVVPDGRGNFVVQEDYKLVTWDVVADPANAGAHPAFVVESKEWKNMDLESIKKDNPELYESIMCEARKMSDADAREHAREALREEFEGQLREESQKIREEAVETARGELLEDPEVAGSVGALDLIKEVVAPFILDEDKGEEFVRLRKELADAHKVISEQDGKLAELEEENEELTEIGKEFGFSLHLERELSGNDRKGQIVEMVGDLKGYDDLDALKTRLEEITSVLAEEDERQAEIMAEIAKVKAQNAKLQEELDQALGIGHKFGIRAYVERKLSMHPHRTKLRTLIDESAPSSMKDVDKIINDYTAEHPVSDEYRAISKSLGHGRKGIVRDPASLNEDEGDSARCQSGFEIAGVSMDELAERAGLRS